MWSYIHFIAENANEQSNTDAIPSAPESKIRDHSLMSTSIQICYQLQAGNLKPRASHLVIFSPELALGFLPKELLWEVIFHLSCLSDALQFCDPGCWWQQEPF